MNRERAALMRALMHKRRPNAQLPIKEDRVPEARPGDAHHYASLHPEVWNHVHNHLEEIKKVFSRGR